MIRSALFTLARNVRGIRAGAAASLLMLGTLGAQAAVAQGGLPAFEACGGTRLVLVPDTADAQDDATLNAARRILNARIGGLWGQRFGASRVSAGRIEVFLPAAIGTGDDIAPLLGRVEISFHSVYTRIDTGRELTLAHGQAIVPDGMAEKYSYVIEAAPLLDGTAIVTAAPMLDANRRPAVGFSFTPQGARTFTTFTANNIGRSFAIVLDGKVLSAPTVRDAISDGRGILTGDFSDDEARYLAASLSGGILPFNLAIVEEMRVDGSDPSADFCP